MRKSPEPRGGGDIWALFRGPKGKLVFLEVALHSGPTYVRDNLRGGLVGDAYYLQQSKVVYKRLLDIEDKVIQNSPWEIRPKLEEALLCNVLRP